MGCLEVIQKRPACEVAPTWESVQERTLQSYLDSGNTYALSRHLEYLSKNLHGVSRVKNMGDNSPTRYEVTRYSSNYPTKPIY